MASAQLDPNRWTRPIRRVGITVCLLLIALFFFRYGIWRVPEAVRGMPSVPPGSWCVVSRGAGNVRPGSTVVFQDAGGHEIVSRVVACDAESVTLRDDAAPNTTHGPIPKSAIVGLVLTTFADGHGSGK
jgi:hypothetical protein